MKPLLKTLIALTLVTTFLLTGCDTADEVLTYEKVSIKTDYKLGHINSSLFTDDALYFTCYTSSYKDRNPDDVDYHTDRRRIIKMDFSGNSKQLPDFDDTLYNSVRILSVDENKNLYISNTITLIDEAGDIAGYESTTSKLDQNGATIEASLLDDIGFFKSVAEGDEYVCISGEKIFIYDSSFQKAAETPTGIEYGDVYNIFSINDSRIICVVKEDQKLHLLTIDRENRCVKERFLIENAYNAYQGNSEYDIIYYDQNEHKIYAQNLGKEPKLLVSFADYGLETVGVIDMKLTESGDIIIVCDIDEWPDGTHSKAGESDVVILKKQ